MPSYTIFSLAALAAIAQAITITSPAMNALWDSSKTNTITWTSVSTDPTTVDIYLAHMAAHPPLNDLLFTNIPISKGSVDVSNLQLPTGDAYQINLVAPGKPEQIYAQSNQFNVTGSAVSAKSTLDGYTATTTGSSSMSTSTSGTATTTGSSSSGTGTASSGSSTSGSGSASGSGTAANASTTPTPTKNAAINVAASAPMAAMVFGVVAMFA